MYGEDYAWLLAGKATEMWWNITSETNCTKNQLKASVQGAFIVSTHSQNVGNKKSDSGLVSSYSRRVSVRLMDHSDI